MNGSTRAGALVSLDPQQAATIVHGVPDGSENIQAIYPLSPLQEGILFHHLLDAQGDTYILSSLFELQSAEQVDSLVDALQIVTERHEMLRSCFMWEQLPEPVQVVQRRVSVRVEKLPSEAGRDPLRQLEALLKPGRAGLNLQQAPLLRLTTACDERTNKHYALLQIHHLICDYRSWHLVVRELLACVGRRKLPAAAPYADYQVRALTGSQQQQAEAFFRAKLSRIDEPVAAFGELDVQGNGLQLSAATLVLDPSLTQQLRTRLRIAGSSVARLFHAAWALVIGAASQRDCVVFGTALSTSRGAMQSPATVTMAVNTLPICLNLRNVSVRELLEHTHRELEELLRWERAPLTLAQRCSGISGTAPLFTALLNYRHAVSRAAENSGAAAGICVLAHHEAWTNYPLALTVDDDGDGITLIVQARGAIDAERVAGQVVAAVHSLTEALEFAPNTPALSLTVLPPEERQLVLRGLNATQAAYDRNALIHELFEAQVQRTPQAYALLHNRRSMTYGELNRRANQLGRYLRERGVGPDTVVAICVGRGFDMVIGLLGILKAGAAYMPLDPTYPPDRLRYMLGDASPPIVLVDEQATLPAPPAGTEVIRLDAQLQKIAESAAENLCAAELNLSSDRLLYVIYTSGSTGAPKGTAMPHRSMINLIEWHRCALPGGGSDRVLQFAALSFDVAFQEIFSTLCTGGQLVLVDEMVRRDPRALIELLHQQAVVRMFLPPVMLQAVAEQFGTAAVALDSLQDVITAGEQLRISAEIVELFERLPRCRLHNHYGPTETHVVTALTLTGSPANWPKLPTIGAPIANTQIYILDERREPVPLGVVGEIYIGGANLARGYLNRAELSAERFVADPFSADSPARMYRTGDLGRWRADGTVEYLGRNDDQVKIRGFRVELGEVEAQLAGHEHVKEVVVVAREDVPGNRCLVAYLTLRDGHAGASDLQAFARSVLPEHMLPSAYVILDRLPLTPSGKIARRSLPPPAPSTYVRAVHEAPIGQIEQELARIWRDLLHVDRLGRHDNFFALGGHSLHGMRLATAVEQRFAVRVPVVTVFQYPTLAGLAARIGAICTELTVDDGEEFDEGVIPVHSANGSDGRATAAAKES
jgi:amino acid adenylation domain-containing protein